MVGCRAVVVALSTARELGLAAVAGAFILFALLAAFVLPARDHNFPGRRLRLFLAVTVLFFVAMIAAVLVLAREPEEEGGHEAGPAETQAETQAETETQPGTQTEPAAEGDAAAGMSVFASAGCGSCHTLEAAGSSGTIGPNLDDLAPAHEAIVEQVTNGGGGMPAFSGQLSETQIQDVAAFVFESTH
jgi:mono/diheme cytochrome c family protein